MTVTANDAGVATVPGLKPGRYTIKAEFSGFDAGELGDVRLRAGDNKQQIELELTAFTDTVEVGQDPQSAAADPNNTLATQLTDEEIEALSDDPNELMRQLVEMAGGAARVRVDGFNGGSLPSRDVIRSIRIVRDTFPAENHSADNDGIDIVTQAGVGPIRGGFSTRVRDSILGGSNPFVDIKAPERTQNFDVNIGGAIVPNKSSFSLFMGGRKQFDTPVATYTTDAGKQSALLGRRPNDGWNLNGMLDYALTKEQMLRVGYSQNASSRSNLGIGGFDLAERAYSNENSGNQLRVQETGPIGKNAFLNTRLQLRLYRTDSRSELEAPTIRVLDGFTSGGAQVTGGVNQKDVELSSDFNYVRGMHTMRTGVQLEGRHYRTDSASNYLGTYIFSSNEDFQIGKARNYTRRVGDPLITFAHLEAAVYVQDDLRLRPNLTFSPGLRYEAADARPRPHRLRSAARIDLGARQERPHDDSHQLRHLLQLAGLEHLRADAARQRRPPAGNQHRQSDLPGYWRCGGRQRDQQVRARRRDDGAHPSLQRRGRSQFFAQGSRQRVVLAGALRQSTARRESQRAGQWRASRSGVRERDRSRSGRLDAHL